MKHSRSRREFIAAGLALPVADAQTLANVELANGVGADPTRGTFLGWAIDSGGTPVAGVSANAAGVLYDDAGQSQLSPGARTGSPGAVALLQVAPTTLTLALTPPPTAPLGPDSFTVPIRAGALTATTLVLPPR